MLTDLTIRNLALIEEARLAFGPGLNAITGETGAGKSLLVAGLELLAGAGTRRGAAAGMVREGSERAEVEGRFQLADPGLAARVERCLRRELPAFVPEWEEDDDERELLLARTVELGGRTRAWINHRPVTRRALAAVARTLFEIHGQNTHQELLETERQVELLDAWGGLDVERAAYGEARARFRAAEAALERHERDRAERRERLERLCFRAEELAALEPRAEEPARLASEREQQRHAVELGREAAGWIDTLSEGDSAAVDRLRGVARGLDRWAGRVDALGDVHAELEQARVHLEEATGLLLSFADGLEHDPRRLEWVEGRLAEYERLARVHSVEPSELAEVAERLAGELEALEHGERDEQTLEEERAAARAALVDAATALARARAAHAGPLAEAVRKALRGLGLSKARLSIEVAAGDGDPGAWGAAEKGAVFGPLGVTARDGAPPVEFRLAANPGEPARPLAEVASGGETARLVLALRSVLAGHEPARVLVFDEIDTGVGGRLGPALGRHLRRLGEHHQVLTVTHLPAIAASAHRHQVVRKAVRRGRTRTAVALLEGDERVLEVADMIAGGARAETARAEARRLLGSAG